MSRKIHSGDTNHHQDRDVEECRRQREAVLGHIGLFGQWLAGRFARRLSQGYLWHSTKKFSAGVLGGQTDWWCLCTSKNMEGAPVISRPAICLANSWRTITKISRDYLPLAQWCNVDDPHMLARNITMVHSGLKPYNAKKILLSAMHTSCAWGCWQACTQISCLDVWDIGVCNLQNAIINILKPSIGYTTTF